MGGIDMQQGLPTGFPVGAGGGMVHNIGVSHGRKVVYVIYLLVLIYLVIRTGLEIPTNLGLCETLHKPKANR